MNAHDVSTMVTEFMKVLSRIGINDRFRCNTQLDRETNKILHEFMLSKIARSVFNTRYDKAKDNALELVSDGMKAAVLAHVHNISIGRYSSVDEKLLETHDYELRVHITSSRYEINEDDLRRWLAREGYDVEGQQNCIDSCKAMVKPAEHYTVHRLP